MEVVEDYRQRIIVDPDSPILAFKASRDRYIDPSLRKYYAGYPYLGSSRSEDALTWNVFRSLQKFNRLDLITDKLQIGIHRGLLLWTLAPETDDVSAQLQYMTGSLIRKFDGIFRGQMTEPDVVLLGTTGIAVIECKLSEPDKPLSHLWEGSAESVERRLNKYLKEIRNLVTTTKREVITPVYQLVRMAFYAVKLAEYFRLEPVVVSLANERNWHKEIRSRKLRMSPAELWDTFRSKIIGVEGLRYQALTWQTIYKLIENTSLGSLQNTYQSIPVCNDSINTGNFSSFVSCVIQPAIK